MAKKNKSKTKTSYNKWNTAKWSLYAGTYILPLTPAAIITGVNWEEWFTRENSWSIGLGFGMMLVTVLITIIGVAKRDKIMTEKVSSLYYLAAILACWAIVLMFLASIANQFGYMLLYTCFGLLGGATCDQIRKSKVDGEVEFYKQLLIDNGLIESERRRKERQELAKQEAEKEAKRRATE